MTTRSKIITSALLIVGLTGIGATDYWFAGREYAATLVDSTNPPARGVAKAGEADVERTIASLGLTLAPSDDLTFLAQVANDQDISSYTILKDNDRVGSVSFIDGDGKLAFISLKEALLSAFSDQVTGLSDKTLNDKGLPTRNVLTFTDPALSEETLTFVRIRERLYEFHTTSGKETEVNAAIQALTAR